MTLGAFNHIKGTKLLFGDPCSFGNYKDLQEYIFESPSFFYNLVSLDLKFPIRMVFASFGFWFGLVFDGFK